MWATISSIILTTRRDCGSSHRWASITVLHLHAYQGYVSDEHHGGVQGRRHLHPLCYLKEQPGTYYLGFNKFALYENCFHEYQKTYLPVNAASTYHLDASTISAKAKALITDAGKREKAEQQAAQLLTDMDSYLASDDAAKACEKMVAYSNQGDYSGLYALASEAYEKSPNLLKLLPITSDASGMGEQIRQKLQGDALYQQMLSASGFACWYCQALADYLWHERELYAYWSDLKFTYNHLCVEGYRRLFLEPLAKGEIRN